MATRLRACNAAAPYTPPTVRGGWSLANAAAFAMNPVGSGASAQTTQAGSTSGTNYMLARFVSPPFLSGGLLDGTVTWVYGGKVSSASYVGKGKIHVYVTTGDTDTPRGTLLNAFTEANGNWGTTAAGHGEGPETLAGVNVLAGDRIVVEAGITAVSGSSSSRTATIYSGSSAAVDLTAGDGDTVVTGRFGWFEFSAADALFLPGASVDTNRRLAGA